MELEWNYDGTRMEGSTKMELQWNGMALMGHRSKGMGNYSGFQLRSKIS